MTRARRPRSVLTGTVDADAKLHMDDGERAAMLAALTDFRNTRIEWSFSVFRSLRSHKASAYYWGVVLTLMAEHSGTCAEDIHDAMCERFLPNEQKRVEFFNRMTGEVLTVDVDHRRSSKLKGGPFYDFVEQVRLFALEFLGVVTPDPDKEYWRTR